MTSLGPLSYKKPLSLPRHGHISTWISFMTNIYFFFFAVFFGLAGIAGSQDHQALRDTTLYISFSG